MNSRYTRSTKKIVPGNTLALYTPPHRVLFIWFEPLSPLWKIQFSLTLLFQNVWIYFFGPWLPLPAWNLQYHWIFYGIT